MRQRTWNQVVQFYCMTALHFENNFGDFNCDIVVPTRPQTGEGSWGPTQLNTHARSDCAFRTKV